MALLTLKQSLFPYDPLTDPESLQHQQQPSKPTTPALLSDLTLGLSDGLTVPFALTAGLSALNSSSLVVTAGLAELFAGAISMGLGGYLAAAGERTAYAAAHTRAAAQVRARTATPRLRAALEPWKLPPALEGEVLAHLTTSLGDADAVQLLLHADGECRPETARPYVAAATIALGYFVGGFVPLAPYLVLDSVGAAFAWSVGCMVVALFGFGLGKHVLLSGQGGRIEGVLEGVKMVLLGGLAAVASVVVVRFVGGGQV